jgi:transposase
MNHTSKPNVSKGDAAVVLKAKHLFSVFSKEAVKVYTEIVPDCARKTLQAIIRGRIDSESIIHSDSWHGYNGLVDLGYKKHYRVHHGKNEFTNGKRHINGIESFWSFAKRRLMKFHGVPKTTFYFYLKESEFRFNYRNHKFYQLILKLLRINPLS